MLCYFWCSWTLKKNGEEKKKKVNKLKLQESLSVLFLNNCSSGMLPTCRVYWWRPQGSAVSSASSGDLQDIFISSALLPPEVHTMYCIARGPLLTVTPPNIMPCNGSLSLARFSIFKKRSLYPRPSNRPVPSRHVVNCNNVPEEQQ